MYWRRKCFKLFKHCPPNGPNRFGLAFTTRPTGQQSIGLAVSSPITKIGITKPPKYNGSNAAPRARLRRRSLGRSNIMVDVERSKLESGLTLLWLSMVGIAAVALFVCAAALLATAEFLYRHLIAPPIAWLLTRLGGLTWHG
jgi:hypothetical protein